LRNSRAGLLIFFLDPRTPWRKTATWGAVLSPNLSKDKRGLEEEEEEEEREEKGEEEKGEREAKREREQKALSGILRCILWMVVVRLRSGQAPIISQQS
jgi:hypothetical protein